MMRNFIAMEKDYINLWEDCKECDTMENKVVHLATKINRLSEPKEYLTSKEAREYLGIGKQTLDNMCSNNLIAYYKPNGKNRLFKTDDLRAYIEKYKHNAV